MVKVVTCSTAEQMGQRAAEEGADAIRRALEKRGCANAIFATGASQFETLKALVAIDDVNWSQVVGFHLDEYLGLSMDHPASFRRYLKQRLVDLVSVKAFHYIHAEQDPQSECRRLNDLLEQHPIDVAFVGIGENGHLAFNDPPADFETDDSYLVVTLDEACRQQQLNEGWFSSLEQVPQRAISMSIRQIMKSRTIICSVPDARKAEAVKSTLDGPVSPQVPASILRRHPRARIYLDRASATLISTPGHG